MCNVSEINNTKMFWSPVLSISALVLWKLFMMPPTLSLWLHLMFVPLMNPTTLGQPVISINVACFSLILRCMVRKCMNRSAVTHCNVNVISMFSSSWLYSGIPHKICHKNISTVAQTVSFNNLCVIKCRTESAHLCLNAISPPVKKTAGALLHFGCDSSKIPKL